MSEQMNPLIELAKYGEMYRALTQERDGWKWANRASLAGEVAETLVARLFYPSWWQAADSKHSSGSSFFKNAEVERGGHDKLADILVDVRDWESGAWRTATAADSQSQALVANAFTEAIDAGRASLSCQVKARFDWIPGSRYDAMKYSTYLDTSRGALTRRQIVEGDQSIWREKGPDLFAWVRFEFTGNSDLLAVVRLAAAQEVRLAIQARCFWEVDSGRPWDEPLQWTSTKLAFPHIFGDEGWRASEDLSTNSVAALNKVGWRQWPVGIDLTEVVSSWWS